jgi:hypothetical protein
MRLLTARAIRSIACTTLGLLMIQPVSVAQISSAQITGTISDVTGALIPGAAVRITNRGTGAVRIVTTNSSGEFVAAALEPGIYGISISAPGFQTEEVTAISLAVAAKQNYIFSLKPGTTQQTVTVSSSANIINTTSAEISSVVNEEAIKELPLNGRDPSTLVFLTTGTTNVLNTVAGVIQAGTSIPDQTGASAGGGRQGSTYYLLDGIPNMDIYELLAAPFPNADATQEFRVISNNYDAQYGFAPSAIVSIRTKSGTDQYHGVVFEFLRNNDLNAGNYFTHSVDPLKRNQFGGGIGGPILKNKLFFFANYEATRASTGSSTNVTFTPTAAMLRGDFSGVPKTLGGPFHTVNGVPNQVDPSLFSSGAIATAGVLPLGSDPATGQTNFVGPVARYYYHEGTARLDYAPSQSQHLVLRTFVQDYQQPSATIPGNILALAAGATGKYQNYLLSHTWTISSTLVNVFGGFWTWLDGSFGGVVEDHTGKPFCLAEVINVATIPGHCYIAGLSATGGFSSPYAQPYNIHRTIWGPTDTLTKTLDKHLISAGVNAYHQMQHSSSDYPTDPPISFSGYVTGFGLADFLLGDATTFLQGGGETFSPEGWQLGLFVQDQYRVSPSFTVTAGVRWEPYLPPTLAGGHGAAFIPGEHSQRYPNAPTGLVFIGDPGVPDTLIPTDYANFEPRIGFAWQPGSLPHTAFRGGFGMFVAPIQYSSYNHTGDISPFSPTFQFSGTPANPISFDNPWASFPGTGGKSPFPPFASIGVNPPADSTFYLPVTVQTVFAHNFKLGVTQSWNLSVEQQLTPTMAFHLAYVGSESYHQTTPLDLNPGIYADGGARTTWPDFNNILENTIGGTASYHSLQASVNKALSHGLQFQSNFTWSKVIDTSSQGSLAWVGGVPDPFNLGYNRGISELNIPLISISDIIYETPPLRGHSALARGILGSWELSGIITMQSGAPFGIVGGDGNNNSESLQYGDRADVTGLPYEVRQGGKLHWLNEYVNPAAFRPNAPGTFGDSAKNLFQAPPVKTVDAGLFKNWQILERYALQFRWEMFNAFNHPSFAAPINDPSVSNFGQITSIGPVPPRVMQGALKFSF